MDSIPFMHFTIVRQFLSLHNQIAFENKKMEKFKKFPKNLRNFNLKQSLLRLILLPISTILRELQSETEAELCYFTLFVEDLLTSKSYKLSNVQIGTYKSQCH